jgi:hypothetical protein
MMDTPVTPRDGMATSGASPAAAPGMEVVDAEGVSLGTVKAVRADDFHLSRDMQRDVCVPLRYVDAVEGNRVRLTLRPNDVSVLNLETPPLL